MTLLLAGHDPAWQPREPVLEPAKPLRLLGTYSGTCPICLKKWSGRRKAQVTCGNVCAADRKKRLNKMDNIQRFRSRQAERTLRVTGAT